MKLRGGWSNASKSGRLAVLQVNRCLSWRQTWQFVSQTSMPKFAVVAKPKIPVRVMEACRRFQEPNHAFGMENGGLRWSTHLCPIRFSSFVELRA